MSRRCSVINCPSINKPFDPYTSTFKFPTCPGIKLQWIEATGRTDWEPTESSVVCAGHFKEIDFINRSNGIFRRKRLRKYAVPSMFHWEEIILSEVLPGTSLNVAQVQVMGTQSDIISNFNIFINHFNEKLDTSNFLIFQTIEKVVFYKLQSSDDDGCNISTRICVNKNLFVKVIIQNTEIISKDLEVLPKNMKLSKWSQISFLLNKYRNEPEVVIVNRKYSQSRAYYYLKKFRDVDESSPQIGKTDILINQLDVLNKSIPKYTSETILFAFLIFAHSQVAYKILRKFLILPQASYLKYISSDFEISPADNQLENDAEKMFTEKEKYVALLIDVIHVEDSLDYMSTPYECDDYTDFVEGIRTVVVFTIKSIFGNYKKIIRLFPILYTASEVLYDLTSSIIKFIQSLCYKVLLVIVDRKLIETQIFKQFCPNQNYIVNPDFPELKIFFQYDTIELLKQLRNDWLNKTLLYPDFEKYSIKKASFVHFELLVKKSPGCKLNRRAINPTIGVDRYNLTLVENLFHDTTIAALQQHDEMKETANFCAIIKKWWSIVNDKKVPIKSITDDSFLFLESFLRWLEVWSTSNAYKRSSVKIDIDALKLTTKTFVDLIKFSFYHCKVDGIVLGKLQTDDISGKFGLYNS